MGQIVSNFFISLDGVVESPDKWHFPYWNDEMGDAVGKGFDDGIDISGTAAASSTKSGPATGPRAKTSPSPPS